MTINIELRPEDESALRERARISGRDLAGYVGLVLKEHLRGSSPDIGEGGPAGGTGATPEHLIDWEAVASCEEEADDEISLDEVRAATSTIKDSMARVVIEEERAERF